LGPKEIRELIDLISRSSFSTFELERNGFRLKLVKAEGAAPRPLGDEAAFGSPAVATTAVELPAAAAPAAAEPTAPPASADGLHELHSPIVGTFFAAPSPGAANFVDLGSVVKKGQVLCIVEAMKVMNEIESEIDGEIAEILVQNGQPVEYGEVLFRLRPS
jgi:acetyl-CoA carboxylase biotin carboxyl carrier protein